MKILLVDDSPDITRAISRVLRAKGFVVAIAPDGNAALSLLGGGLEPDVIICDGDMPNCNGRQFHDALPPELRSRCVFFTGSPELFAGLPNTVVLKSDGHHTLMCAIYEARAESEAA